MQLGHLRCLAPGCRGKGPLRIEDHGVLVCATCGTRRSYKEHFRSYGGRTAQWIIGGSVMMSVGYTRAGALRTGMLALGMLWMAYALVRIIWQALSLRAIERQTRALP